MFTNIYDFKQLFFRFIKETSNLISLREIENQQLYQTSNIDKLTKFDFS